MRISDWSSDVCSSDLDDIAHIAVALGVDAVQAVGERLGDRPGEAELGAPEIIIAVADLGRALMLELRLGGDDVDQEIGRASCRGRVCQYVEISGVDVYLKK